MTSHSSTVKLVPLGGSGNVTDNMFVYETDKDILIVDCGIGFPDELIPGIDITIPDITYLRDKLDKIRGIVISHAHEDHIGALPFIWPQLQKEVPIYASRLTAGFIQEKMAEFNLPTNMIQVIGDRQPIKLGDFEFKLIPITHSVPDTKHIVIKTPLGTIYHGSDFKFDWTPVGQQLPDVQSITKIGAEGVKLLLSDCLRSERKGYSPSEASVEDALEREFRSVKGKVVVTTMSSNISRIEQIIKVAQRNHRYVALVGRSVERNMKVAQRLGFAHPPQDAIIDKRKIKHFSPNQICLIVAGSQGQMGSSLTRIAQGDHDLQLGPDDKVIFSSDIIPGNETNVYRIIDLLSRSGIEVSYSDILDGLHVSGHAYARELMMLMAMVKADYVMPIGGTYRHMIQYGKLAKKMGYHDQQIILNESQILELRPDGSVVPTDTLEIKTVYVEGDEAIDSDKQLADRKLMFQEGAVVVLVNLENKRTQVDFDILPKGIFRQLTKSEINQLKQELTKSLTQEDLQRDRLYLKDKVAKTLNTLFVTRLQLNPLIIPIIIEN